MVDYSRCHLFLGLLGLILWSVAVADRDGRCDEALRVPGETCAVMVEVECWASERDHARR